MNNLAKLSSIEERIDQLIGELHSLINKESLDKDSRALNKVAQSSMENLRSASDEIQSYIFY
jgi:hypothetical protein